MPPVIKGGLEDRTRAANLRRKIKAGKKLNSDQQAWIDAWEARVASMPIGRPKKEAQQSVQETAADGGTGQPGTSDVTPSPPVDPPAPVPPAEASPALEAPPVVQQPRPMIDGKDWRDKYRASGLVVDDGREMLCLQIASGMISALDSMCSDMKKAGVDPWLETMGLESRKLLPIYVLAWDEILPAKARMTPKIAMMVTSAITAGQRSWHHKKITAALAHDPETLEWKRRQAEREATEQAQRTAHVEETKQPPVQYAAPPPAPEPEAPSLNGKRTFEAEPKAAVRHIASDEDRLL